MTNTAEADIVMRLRYGETRLTIYRLG